MAPSKGKNQRRTDVFWHIRGFFCGKIGKLTFALLFLAFRCGGTKEVAGKPQERGNANISLRS